MQMFEKPLMLSGLCAYPFLTFADAKQEYFDYCYKGLFYGLPLKNLGAARGSGLAWLEEVSFGKENIYKYRKLNVKVDLYKHAVSFSFPFYTSL